MLSHYSLAGKTALVTGASQGIGRATARVLAGCGADIVINHLGGGDGAEELAAQVRGLGRRAWIFEADVSSESDVDQLFGFIRGECGPLDILVNNAGTSRAQDIFSMSLADWKFIVNTNLTSCFLTSRRALEMMREKGTGGSIVNMSSVVAHQGALFGPVHYAATKSGLLGFTKTLARTAAPFRVTVNTVAPGIIATPLLVKTHGEEGVKKLTSNVPLGRLGEPEEIGFAAAFLCSAAARYLTGATLDVNGGMHMR